MQYIRVLTITLTIRHVRVVVKRFLLTSRKTILALCLPRQYKKLLVAYGLDVVNLHFTQSKPHVGRGDC